MIALTLLTLLTATQTRITDFSNANYIPIVDGSILVWEQLSYVRHSSSLSNFYKIIEDTKKMSEFFPHSHMRKLLDIDVEHIETLLSALTVHHRMARSLDFLGTALKIVAGTPDAADLEKIKMTESQLIDSNNRQVLINTETQKQINKLTDTVNKIIQAKKGELVDTPHLFETLMTRNRMLITEIQNLILTITLAKSNIINPTIFDTNDLKSIFDNQLTEVPVVNLMEVSKIKILQSEDEIHMLIEYPRIKQTCKKTVILPVSHNHTVLQIRDDIIAECDDGIFAVSDCELTNYATFCKKSTRESCAREIHAGGVANCRTQPSHLLPVALIDEGTIVINEQHVQVTVDEGPLVMLKGTHLITFEHVAVINNTRYLNHNAVVGKSPSIATSPLLNITGHDQILSLSSIHRMSEQNINFIRQLKDEVEAGGSPKVWFMIGVGISIVFCASIIGHLCCHRRRASLKLKRAIAQLDVTEAGHELKGGVVNKQHFQASIEQPSHARTGNL